MKLEKSFFNFEKNDEHENFDDDESNANNESSANANNLFDIMNENENQTDFARDSQKKENAMTKIVRDESTKFDSKTTEKSFFIFN